MVVFQQDTTHAVVRAALEAERTHQNVGRLLAACMVAVKARIFIMPVAPHGCGKSTAGWAMQRKIPDALAYDTVTRSGLKRIQDKLSNFRSLFFIDDLGKGDTQWGRIQTITSLCELTYSHFITKISAKEEINITNFQGSAIACIQPIIIRDVMKAPEWDAVILDKSIRYYHMFRPVKPNRDKLVLRQWNTMEIEEVESPSENITGYDKLVEIGMVQWGRTRVSEHWDRLLRAVAALDGRSVVDEYDVALAEWIFRPMYAERHLARRTELEGELQFDNNLLCFFVEWASHGAFSVQDLIEDYHISQATAYSILAKYRRYWEPTGGEPNRYAPSSTPLNQSTGRTMYDVLSECGIDWKQEE